jgi:Lipase (class 3)
MSKIRPQTIAKLLFAVSMLSGPFISAYATTATTTPYGSFCSSGGLQGGCYGSVEAAGAAGWAEFSRIYAHPELFSYAGTQRYIPPEWQTGTSLIEPGNIGANTPSNNTTYWWMYTYNQTQVTFNAYNIFYRATKPLDKMAYMSNDVYHGCNSKHGFTCIGSYGDKTGFGANVYRDGNKVVVAIRGTDNFYNVLTDYALGTGKADQSMIDAVKQVSDLITQIKASIPDADISLTGHSLGGGIAQIVAAANGISADTFNAPGVAQVVENNPNLVTKTLPPGSSSSSKITNYRMEGDQVSNAGKNLPSVEVVTVANSNYTSILDVKAAHSMDGMLTAISSDARQTPGSTGMDIVPSLTVPIPGIGNTSVAGIWDVIADVVSGITRYVDPAPGWKFTLTSESNSPGITSISLPTDVFGWEISAFDGTTWNDYFLSGSNPVSFDSSVYDIKFNAVDSLHNDIFYPDHFIYALTFDKDGTFNGKMTVVSALGDTEVPEPTTLFIFLLGAAALVFVWKHKHQ